MYQAARIGTWAFLSLCLAGVFGVVAAGIAAEVKKAFTLTPDEHGMVLKTPDGRTVFRYMTRKPAGTKLTANSVCCLYPVKTPSGEDVVEFAPDDHPHHRGVFMTWHAIEGNKPADFWGWGEWAPTKDRVIQNRTVKLLKADAKGAQIAVRNAWVAEGEAMIDEATVITARQLKEAFVIDLDFRLTPAGDVTLRQTAFGGLCVKSRKDGKAAYYDPKGEVKLAPPHHLKPETDWPAADWYDYTIQLESGKTVGVAVLDHPGNPPSRWHNLGAIAMVNPCIVAPGPVVLKAGHPLRLRYRLVVHDGPTPAELLNRLSARWRAGS
ncbi:MAG: PmoA family protein [Thermoguttaceae bacterium]